MQHSYSLRESDRLDRRTIEVLQQPRCGNPDETIYSTALPLRRITPGQVSDSTVWADHREKLQSNRGIIHDTDIPFNDPDFTDSSIKLYYPRSLSSFQVNRLNIKNGMNERQQHFSKEREQMLDKVNIAQTKMTASDVSKEGHVVLQDMLEMPVTKDDEDNTVAMVRDLPVDVDQYARCCDRHTVR